MPPAPSASTIGTPYNHEHPGGALGLSPAGTGETVKETVGETALLDLATVSHLYRGISFALPALIADYLPSPN
jgi:hypothetical protein